jgi:hypothetical protein
VDGGVGMEGMVFARGGVGRSGIGGMDGRRLAEGGLDGWFWSETGTNVSGGEWRGR